MLYRLTASYFRPLSVKNELLLLVSVFPKTLFTLVRGHFVLLSFLSARHIMFFNFFDPQWADLV